jgi:glycerophosphoryl diester phosphodiesterase
LKLSVPPSPYFALALFGALWLSAAAHHSQAENRPDKASQRVSRPGVLIIAHRGDSRVAPENTVPAFTSAVKAGADLVELDYYHSADGVPVVSHDGDLDRTTDAKQLWGGTKLPIASKSLAELKLLDAGNWYGAKFAGTRIPTLVEALEAIQAGSITLIERKGGDPATCVELLKQKKLLDDVVVQAFDWDYLTGCHALAPQLVLAALGHKQFTPAKLDQIAKTGASIVAWEDKFTSASTIAAIHARGWKAWVWTVDDPARVTELVKAKIDGIITNRPFQTRMTVEDVKLGG